MKRGGTGDSSIRRRYITAIVMADFILFITPLVEKEGAAKKWIDKGKASFESRSFQEAISAYTNSQHLSEYTE